MRRETEGRAEGRKEESEEMGGRQSASHKSTNSGSSHSDSSLSACSPPCVFVFYGGKLAYILLFYTKVLYYQ